MQVSKKHLMVVPLIATLAACASLPDGPTVQAMPGSGKTFDQFQADDYSCRGYASNTAGNPQDAQVNSTLGSAALGTAVGALAGAAIGGGRGAGVGAGAGLLFGTAAGADAGNASGYSVQRRYDMAYSQCMYAKGEKVPMGRQYQSSYAPPPPPRQVTARPRVTRHPHRHLAMARHSNTHHLQERLRAIRTDRRSLYKKGACQLARPFFLSGAALAIESIANCSFRHQILRLRGIAFQLGPQVTHVDADIVAAVVVSGSPYLAQQLTVRHHLAGI